MNTSTVGRKAKIGLLALAGLVLGLGAFLWLDGRPANSDRARVVQLSDGSRLRVWHATFGTQHEFVIGRFPSLDPLRRRYPWVAGFLGGVTEQIKDWHSADGMCVFYSWLDDAGNVKPDPPWMVYCRDEHGCELELDTGRGESYVRGTNVAHQFSSLYPRRSERFVVRFSEQGSGPPSTGMVTVRNPVPWRGTNWVPETFPATREVEGLKVVFLGWGSSEKWPGPHFRLEEGGVERSEWRAEKNFFRDVTGNETQLPRLCRHEPAWEVEASFVRDMSYPFGDDEAWTIWEGRLPGPGEVEMLEGRRTLHGLQIEVLAMGGRGRYELRKSGGGPWNLFKAEKLPDDAHGDGTRRGGPPSSQNMTLTRDCPWVVLSLGGLQPTHSWKMVIRDRAGKWSPSSGWSSMGSEYTVALPTKDPSEITAVRVVVQRLRTVAFRVPPPKIPAP